MPALSKNKKNNDLQSVGSLQTLASEAEVDTELTVQTGEEEATSDFGEEANAGLRHSKEGLLGRDTERSVDRQTNATTHWERSRKLGAMVYTGRQIARTGDAVHDSNVRGLEGTDVVVEGIFGLEKFGSIMLLALSSKVDDG